MKCKRCGMELAETSSPTLLCRPCTRSWEREVEQALREVEEVVEGKPWERTRGRLNHELPDGWIEVEEEGEVKVNWRIGVSE
jgi:hypothetical protein